MLITIHMTDGRKITKDEENIRFFSMRQGYALNAERIVYDLDGLDGIYPQVSEGCICVNLDNVVDMRPAEKEEIDYARIHGW